MSHVRRAPSVRESNSDEKFIIGGWWPCHYSFSIFAPSCPSHFRRRSQPNNQPPSPSPSPPPPRMKFQSGSFFALLAAIYLATTAFVAVEGSQCFRGRTAEECAAQRDGITNTRCSWCTFGVFGFCLTQDNASTHSLQGLTCNVAPAAAAPVTAARAADSP